MRRLCSWNREGYSRQAAGANTRRSSKMRRGGQLSDIGVRTRGPYTSAMIRKISLFLVCLAGCNAAPEGGTDPLAGVPADFSLELTVLGGSKVPAAAESRTPSRYVLLADGSLHYAADPLQEQGPSWLPPLTRILSRHQIAELWSLAVQLGFTDPRAAQEPMNFKLVRAADDEVLYLLSFHADERRWTFT